MLVGIRFGALGLAAALAAIAAPVAAPHAVGTWLYPPQVGLKLEAKGFPLPACNGRRAYRFTSHSNPNSAQTWQFRHFACFTYDAVGGRGSVYICAHSLAGGRVSVTQVTFNNGYRPCRF